MTAVQMAEPLVVRMNRHAGVAQHGLGPGGGDRMNSPLRTLDRVAQIPEMAVDLGLLHLEIRDGRLQLNVPVHQPLVAVDQAGLVQRDEGVDHGPARGPRPW